MLAFLLLTPKPPTRPATGSPLRKKADSPRDHYLLSDVTKDEKRAILEYCIRHKVSVSQFLAELALADAKDAAANPKREDLEKCVVVLNIPRSQHMKLTLLARLQEKSIDELVQDLVLPSLETRQPPGSLETETIRYYLSKAEHQIVKQHIAKQGMSARNYVSLLAMEAIAKDSKKPK